MASDTPRPSQVTTHDGLDLALRHWGSAAAVSRGTLVVVHGLGEHIGRYEHVARFLAGRGWRVIGFDQRGHGRSAGKRGSVPSDEALVDDLALVIDRVARPATAPDEGLLLLGHSLGGLVAAQFVARGTRHVDGLVLSSPALGADVTVAQRLQLFLGGLLAPDLAVSNQLKVDRISHDPAVVRAYREDPLVHDRLTARLALATLAGGREVLAAAAGWRTRTLLMWAGDDHLVAARASAAFAAAAPANVVRSRCFDAMYHEILNEPDARTVFDLLADWLDGAP
jgi:alpha-beta hydrolase superfamily lysophospholipase